MFSSQETGREARRERQAEQDTETDRPKIKRVKGKKKSEMVLKYF